MPALFIVNPAARGGRGRSAAPRVRAALSALRTDADVVLSEAPGAAEELAADAVRRDFAPVVAVGGDGTVHEVVNGLLRGASGPPGSGGRDAVPPALGIIPTGSGNDFARAAALPRTVESGVRAVLQGPRRRVDAARCGARFFLNAASVGFDAHVAAVVARAGSLLRASGPLLYPLAVVRALPRYGIRALQLELDGRRYERRALLVAVANGPYYGGGFHICPGAEPDDGWLDVCVLGDLSLLQALRLLPRLRAGTHVGAEGVERFRARTVRVAGGGPVQLDGEPWESAPAEFVLIPGALTLHGATEPSQSSQAGGPAADPDAGA